MNSSIETSKATQLMNTPNEEKIRSACKMLTTMLNQNNSRQQITREINHFDALQQIQMDYLVSYAFQQLTFTCPRGRSTANRHHNKNILRVMCGGGCKAIGQRALNRPPEVCLSSIAKYVALDKYLYGDCYIVADVLLSSMDVVSFPEQLVHQLLKCILKQNTCLERDTYLKRLWEIHDIVNYPIGLVEKTLEEAPFILESILIKMIKNTEEERSGITWRNGQYRCLVNYCSQSGYIFCAVTSIFNQLILSMNAPNEMITFVSKFIEEISKQCDQLGLDMVSLYPVQYRAVVTLLCLDPWRLGAHQSRIACMITSRLDSQPAASLLLLTHYPEWLEFTKQQLAGQLAATE